MNYFQLNKPIFNILLSPLSFKQSQIINTIIISLQHSMSSQFCAPSAQSYFFKWLSEQSVIYNHHIETSFPLQVPLEAPILEEKKIILQVTSDQGQMIPQDHKSEEYLKVMKTRKGKMIGVKNDDNVVKSRKDPNFNLKKQKKNRNVFSNLVHHLFKYIHDFQQINQVVDKIIFLHKIEITSEQFFMIYSSIQDQFKGYVTEKNLKSLWKGQFIGKNKKQNKQKAQEFGRVIRLLSFWFYRQNCRGSIFFSNKLSLESKKLHYQGLTQMKQFLESKQIAFS